MSLSQRTVKEEAEHMQSVKFLRCSYRKDLLTSRRSRSRRWLESLSSPQQNPNSRCLQAKLRILEPEQETRPSQSQQQSHQPLGIAKNSATTAAEFTESHGESGMSTTATTVACCDAETGDVILVFQEQEHSVFKRNDPSLLLRHSAI